MTTAERLRREGRQEGMEKGMEKGLVEGMEKGLVEGMEKGLVEGKMEALSRTAIRLLTKKFGVLSKELKDKIQKLDLVTLEVLIDNIFDYESLEDLNKFLK